MTRRQRKLLKELARIPVLEVLWKASLLALEEKKKELAALQKEYERLREEITEPRCHDCNAVLGDNWCADCARKATQ